MLNVNYISIKKIVMGTLKLEIPVSAFRMGEDNSKWSNWQRNNLENIQATPRAQLQKNKWPNQKMGQRTK